MKKVWSKSDIDRLVKETDDKYKSNNDKKYLYMKCANLYLEHNEYMEALQFIMKYTKCAPKDVAGYKTLGFIQEQMGDVKEALKTYRRCSELNHLDRDIKESVTKLYSVSKEPMFRKRAWLEKMEKEMPHSAHTHTLKCHILQETGNIPQLELYLTKQLQSNPLNAPTQVQLIELLASKKNCDDALAYCCKINHGGAFYRHLDLITLSLKVMLRYIGDANRIEYNSAEQILRTCDWIISALIKQCKNVDEVRQAWINYDYCLFQLSENTNFNTTKKWHVLACECSGRLWLHLGSVFSHDSNITSACNILALSVPPLASHHIAAELYQHRIISAGLALALQQQTASAIDLSCIVANHCSESGQIAILRDIAKPFSSYCLQHPISNPSLPHCTDYSSSVIHYIRLRPLELEILLMSLRSMQQLEEPLSAAMVVANVFPKLKTHPQTLELIHTTDLAQDDICALLHLLCQFPDLHTPSIQEFWEEICYTCKIVSISPSLRNAGVLKKGLWSIRGLAHHGLGPTQAAALAKYFAHRAALVNEAGVSIPHDKYSSRCGHYWKLAYSIITSLLTSTYKRSKDSLFTFESLDECDLNDMSKEAGLSVAGVLVSDGKFAQALDVYGSVDTAQAAYNASQVYLHLTDIANSPQSKRSYRERAREHLDLCRERAQHANDTEILEIVGARDTSTIYKEKSIVKQLDFSPNSKSLLQGADEQDLQSISTLHRDIGTKDKEVSLLRDEIAQLREEMSQLKSNLNQQLSSPQIATQQLNMTPQHLNMTPNNRSTPLWMRTDLPSQMSPVMSQNLAGSPLHQYQPSAPASMFTQQPNPASMFTPQSNGAVLYHSPAAPGLYQSPAVPGLYQSPSGGTGMYQSPAGMFPAQVSALHQNTYPLSYPPSYDPPPQSMYPTLSPFYPPTSHPVYQTVVTQQYTQHFYPNDTVPVPYTQMNSFVLSESLEHTMLSDSTKDTETLLSSTPLVSRNQQDLSIPTPTVSSTLAPTSPKPLFDGATYTVLEQDKFNVPAPTGHPVPGPGYFSCLLNAPEREDPPELDGYDSNDDKYDMLSVSQYFKPGSIVSATTSAPDKSILITYEKEPLDADRAALYQLPPNFYDAPSKPCSGCLGCEESEVDIPEIHRQDTSILITYEKEPTDADRAALYQLPPNFYDAPSKPCSGCLGCEEEGINEEAPDTSILITYEKEPSDADRAARYQLPPNFYDAPSKPCSGCLGCAEEAPDTSILITYEKEPSDAERAALYQLPPNFYDAPSKPCSGCLGCEVPPAPVIYQLDPYAVDDDDDDNYVGCARSDPNEPVSEKPLYDDLWPDEITEEDTGQFFMPQQQDTTAECEEAAIFTQQCTLYQYDPRKRTYIDVGSGKMEILSSSARVQFRISFKDEDGTLRASHAIESTMYIECVPNSNKEKYIWFVPIDYTDPETPLPRKFMAYFSVEGTGEEFSTAFVQSSKEMKGHVVNHKLVSLLAAGSPKKDVKPPPDQSSPTPLSAPDTISENIVDQELSSQELPSQELPSQELPPQELSPQKQELQNQEQLHMLKQDLRGVCEDLRSFDEIATALLSTGCLDNSVQFVKEILPSSEYQALEAELYLPVGFFNYLNHPKCEGCLGCETDEEEEEEQEQEEECYDSNSSESDDNSNQVPNIMTTPVKSNYNAPRDIGVSSLYVSPSTAVFGAGPPSTAVFGAGPPSTAVFGAGPSSTAVFGAGPPSTAVFGAGPPSTAVFGAGPPSTAVFGAGPPSTAVFGAGPPSTAVFGSGPPETNIFATPSRPYIATNSPENFFLNPLNHDISASLQNPFTNNIILDSQTTIANPFATPQKAAPVNPFAEPPAPASAPTADEISDEDEYDDYYGYYEDEESEYSNEHPDTD